MLRTHTCNELSAKEEGMSVTLCGWTNARRDHGGLVFIDLRDCYGTTQLVIAPEQSKAFSCAQLVRSEWVLKASGTVRKRLIGTERSDIATGTIEIVVDDLEVVSESKTPPFPLDDTSNINEELRLQYRFLDLRTERMKQIILKRDAFLTAIRAYMHRQGFVEVQTPILTSSSPEGARDFLVPSRLHQGQFYALPQAPQQFKQLLMVSGIDRYFQIAPCFRDEDPRADRHPGEFYQLDMEMSFVEQDDVFDVIEPLMVQLTEQFSAKTVTAQPFPRIPWRQSMTRYGSDKPDLRYNFFISDVSPLVQECGFSVFTDALSRGGVVHALHVPNGGSLSRGDIDALTQEATLFGAKGLAYILIREGTLSSPILKYVGEECARTLINQARAQSGDALFFGADSWEIVCRSLGAVRSKAAQLLGAIDRLKAAWAWIVDFPMYEWNEKEGKIDFSHNPFSMPQGGFDALERKDPLTILAHQYDLVCNGFEISSGAIRNHRPDIMYKAFALAGYSRDDVDAKFGGMIRAFQYGAPVHGGIAPGVDRLMMVLWECESIRDIYAFPKNGRAQDILMGAPSPIDEAQLKELGIVIKQRT